MPQHVPHSPACMCVRACMCVSLLQATYVDTCSQSSRFGPCVPMWPGREGPAPTFSNCGVTTTVELYGRCYHGNLIKRTPFFYLCVCVWSGAGPSSLASSEAVCEVIPSGLGLAPTLNHNHVQHLLPKAEEPRREGGEKERKEEQEQQQKQNLNKQNRVIRGQHSP